MGIMDRISPCKTSLRPLRNDGYYLECRKDAQCECSICKESITATLDLRQPLKSSTKENQPWPPPFPCSSPTPSSAPRKRSLNTHTPFRSSTLQHCRPSFRLRILPLPLLILLSMLFLFAMPWLFSFFSQAYFSYDSFTELAQASLVRVRLLDRLDFVQRRVSRISKSPAVSNCTGYGDASSWRLAENGHLVHSKCMIYASLVERVSVWGSSAMTGGVLGRSLVDRSFTVLAGRVTEWEEGRIQSIVHTEGSSWTMNRWAASAVVLDSNTWILEYKKTPASVGIGGIRGLKHVVTSAVAKGVHNLKLYIDMALFMHTKGSEVLGLQAMSTGSSRQPPT